MAETKKYLDLVGLKAYDEKIKALIKQAGKSEEEIKAIITKVVGSLPEDATESTILAYLENKISAVDNKVGDISSLTSETVTSLAGALSTEIDRAVAAEKTLQDQIDKLEAGDDGELAEKVATLIGDDAGKSARTIAAEELAAQLIPADAKESLDTLQEIAAWIQSHPDDAASMSADIQTLKDEVASFNAITTDEINALFTE